jgi:hypothetical protein
VPAASEPEAAPEPSVATERGEGSRRISLIQGGQVVWRGRALSREALAEVHRKRRAAPKAPWSKRAKTPHAVDGVATVNSYQHSVICLRKSKGEREGRCHACYLAQTGGGSICGHLAQRCKCKECAKAGTGGGSMLA